ncbi:fatty acid desaturase family protein [Streptomyces sp. NPDC088258]|uniref:fatty acid desaturase family protein n=1 Tax=Streptomyces sp. NPDC088258 TaxID=3365849 RepID=UPI0037F455A2
MQSPQDDALAEHSGAGSIKPLAAVPDAVRETPAATVGASATFAELLQRVKAEGLLNPARGYYVSKLALNTALLAIGFAAFFALGDSWLQLLVAVWMGLCGAQSAFMWHDAGHKSMFGTHWTASLMGYIHANLVNGVSYGWWVNHHNRHHSHPNHLEKDPDIGRRTAIFDMKQYPSRSKRGRFIVRYQSVLFFVLLVLESYKMQRTAVQTLARNEVRRRWLEAALIVLRAAIYLTCVFVVLPPLLGVVFILVQQAVLGVYFGLIFAPNHKGMAVRDGEEEELDWLARQVLTSRNIRPSLLMDFLYGGLNYQVEHHLFPAMPQRSLRRARELTREYCAERGMPYHEVGFWASYREVATFLHEVSAPAREERAAA